MTCGESIVYSMPSAFSNVDEARSYWELIMRRLTHFLAFTVTPVDTGIVENPEDSVGFMGVRPDGSLKSTESQPGKKSEKLKGSRSSAKSPIQPDFSNLQQKYLKECRDWWVSFSPLYERRHHRTCFISIVMLRLRYVSAYCMLACFLSNNQTIYDNYIEDFREIVFHAKTMLAHETSNTRFTFDLGFIAQLYIAGARCRDRGVRRDAIALLLSKPRREGVWDSILAGNMARAIMDVEEEGMPKGNDLRPLEENRLKGTIMSFNLFKRSAKLTCVLNRVDTEGRVVVKEREIHW